MHFNCSPLQQPLLQICSRLYIYWISTEMCRFSKCADFVQIFQKSAQNIDVLSTRIATVIGAVGDCNRQSFFSNQNSCPCRFTFFSTRTIWEHVDLQDATFREMCRFSKCADFVLIVCRFLKKSAQNTDVFVQTYCNGYWSCLRLK